MTERMIENDLFDNLNPEQIEAVKTIDKPVLVLAGAGSGKTRVLTRRIAYLISRGISPWNILAVTFTNKAANEMKTRVFELVGDSARNLWIGTFHSICLRLLRQNCGKLGYENNFVIYDSGDQLSLIKECMKEINIDAKVFTPKEIQNEIEGAKTYNITPDEFLGYRDGNHSSFLRACEKVYFLYNNKLKQRNAMDFNDILVNGLRLLTENSDVLEYYRKKFSYILIDEYQDTNEVQYRLIKSLCSQNTNICAVGDEDQAIYGWRGADIRNILNFEHDFPGYHEVRLETNYRSTGKILSAASEMIKNNRTSKGKYLKAVNGEGENILCFHAQDAYDEAHFIAREISSLIRRGVDYSNIAVFYRVNWLSRVFETVFKEYGIPYKIIGGLRFYERREIKDLMAYIRIAVNRADDAAFERIVNVPKRGIGKTSVEKFKAMAFSEELSVMDVLEKNQHSLSGALKKKIPDFVNTVKNLENLALNEKPSAFMEYLLKETGLIDFYHMEEDGNYRIENIKEFVSAVREYENNNTDATLADFLQTISLYSDSDEETESGEVVMMTLHNAKGLEFPYVFITGIEEEILPHSRSLDEESELEEERRLFYVGITRGMKKVYFSFTYARNIFGNIKYSRPSRFLSEIPQSLITF